MITCGRKRERELPCEGGARTGPSSPVRRAAVARRRAVGLAWAGHGASPQLPLAPLPPIGIGGGILVSSVVRDLVAGGPDVTFSEGREVELKGIEGLHRLFAVDLESAPTVR